MSTAVPSDAPSPGEIEFGNVKRTREGSPWILPEGVVQRQRITIVEGEVVEFAPTKLFIDLHVMLGVHHHAAEEMTIELGGLLLGRRGTSVAGEPCTMITASLRARHAIATRGSFQFTHATWADLDQQRRSLWPELEIVGWYHTHPGWGVFLSALDTFICKHFFSHPDDCALVIDPTSGEMGVFVQRDVDPAAPPRRLDRYWLFVAAGGQADAKGPSVHAAEEEP